MNKKIIIRATIVIVVIVACVGCFLLLNNDNKDLTENDSNAQDVLNNSSVNNNSSNFYDEDDTNDNTSNNGKTLVVYFSKTGENYSVGNIEVGNTALMASYIVEYLNADSFEIVPVTPYPDSYEEAKNVATEEKNRNARPEIKNNLNNLSDYDTIFIGYPIWWGDMPMIVYTFLESYDFSGKNIIPFNTHEGSGNAGTFNTIKNKLSSANVNTNGFALRGGDSRTNDGKEQTINWLKSLGY